MNPEGLPGSLIEIRVEAERGPWEDTWQPRLHPSELEALEGFSAAKRRQDWLLGRAAAKTAVRELLRREGQPLPDWAELPIAKSPEGAPRLGPAPGHEPLALSLSHGHGRGAAWATRPGLLGGLPGVDLERVRPRKLGTLRFYLHPPEREQVLALEGPDGDPDPDGPWSPRDLGAIVWWALKEAAFKALQPPRGVGLLDTEVSLRDPFDTGSGRAEVRYRGRCRELAERLGVTEVSAGWRREDDRVLAWVLAHGGALPQT